MELWGYNKWGELWTPITPTKSRHCTPGWKRHAVSPLALLKKPLQESHGYSRGWWLHFISLLHWSEAIGWAEKVRWHRAPMQGTIRRAKGHTQVKAIMKMGESWSFYHSEFITRKGGTFGNFKIEVSIRFTVKCQVETTVGNCSPFSIFFLFACTKWGPYYTYKLNCNPNKSHYKWVTGVCPPHL